MLKDCYECRKPKAGMKDIKEKRSQLAVWIYQIKIPPEISLIRSGVDKVTIWVIIILSIFTGFLSGFMGIGGELLGFLY